MDNVLVLVIRLELEAALAAIRDHLGNVEVRKVFTGDNTIVHISQPLGHDVYRWYHEENKSLVWFNTSAH